ncbi:MAG: twin-arginine translocase TatA/TatE family subunit [Deltaproteobacteria bacterium]|nr:MAG: twin-arginine translocase TatA/TatE family subunit [Deltaproteobacteria bacterium]
MFIAFGMPGPTEWIIILIIVVIFFGVGKLPTVLSQMGKGVKAFKDGMREGEEDIDKIRKEIDVTPSSNTDAARVKEAEEVSGG